LALRLADMKKEKTSYTVILIFTAILMAVAAYIFVVVIIGTDNKSADPGPEIESSPDPDNISIPGGDAGGDNNPDPSPEPGNESDSISLPEDRVEIINIAGNYPGLKTQLDEEALSHDSAAVSLVVYDGNAGKYYTYFYGHADISADRPVTADTMFRIASLSKLVVVIVAMKLVDGERLDLDEDISEYLGYEVRNPNHPDIPITSRMLMQHTSSIFDSQTFLDSIAGRERVSTQNLLSGSSSYWDVRPGTAFEYSNFGYSILAAVCELISGYKLDDLARELLFEPLDIDASFLATNIRDRDNIAMIYSSGYHLNRSVSTQLENSRAGELGEDQHLAQGSLVISVPDYAKILAMLGNGGVFRNERILSPESVIEIHNADVSGAGYKQGLSSRFTAGGSTAPVVMQNTGEDEDDIYEENRNDGIMWQYIDVNGSAVPSDGFYWHTGSAYGVFAQYIYKSGSGTGEGIADVNSSLGVVVVTTGANTDRSSTGMINVCTHLSEIAWRGLGFNTRN